MTIKEVISEKAGVVVMQGFVGPCRDVSFGTEQENRLLRAKGKSRR